MFIKFRLVDESNNINLIRITVQTKIRVKNQNKYSLITSTLVVLFT